MNHNTIDTIATAVVGTAAVTGTGIVADNLPTAETIQTIGQLVIQLVIGVITIYRLLKRKK